MLSELYISFHNRLDLVHSDMGYGKKTNVKECTDLQADLKRLEKVIFSGMFIIVNTFEQYQTRSRVTHTRAKYRRGPSLMKVLKY